MRLPVVVLLGCLLLHGSVGPQGALAVSENSADASREVAPPVQQVSTPWRGETVQDLWNEYRNIFKFGNRNAASHLWSTFILERSAQMSPKKLELFFSGFCAVSGSPVRPNDYNRYLLRLDTVDGKKRVGAMHYCCWPCVCDTQDFIRVDTKTVVTTEGPRKYHFAVLGNPCDKAHKLHEPFVQPFGFRQTTLAQEAAEVRCVDGKLQGATLSDHGFIIINMFFDLPTSDELSHAEEAQQQVSTNATTPSSGAEVVVPQDLANRFGSPQPGRVRSEGGVQVQDEYEWKDMCTQRAQAGYNSGMGEIFRKVIALDYLLCSQSTSSTVALTARWHVDALGDSNRSAQMLTGFPQRAGSRDLFASTPFARIAPGLMCQIPTESGPSITVFGGQCLSVLEGAEGEGWGGEREGWGVLGIGFFIMHQLVERLLRKVRVALPSRTRSPVVQITAWLHKEMSSSWQGTRDCLAQARDRREGGKEEAEQCSVAHVPDHGP